MNSLWAVFIVSKPSICNAVQITSRQREPTKQFSKTRGRSNKPESRSVRKTAHALPDYCLQTGALLSRRGLCPARMVPGIARQVGGRFPLQRSNCNDRRANPSQPGSNHTLPLPILPFVYQEVRRLTLAARVALGCRGVSCCGFPLRRPHRGDPHLS